jgi:hypothetical protein
MRFEVSRRGTRETRTSTPTGSRIAGGSTPTASRIRGGTPTSVHGGTPTGSIVERATDSSSKGNKSGFRVRGFCAPPAVVERARESEVDYNRSVTLAKSVAEIQLKRDGKDAGVRAILDNPTAFSTFVEFLKKRLAAENALSFHDIFLYRTGFDERKFAENQARARDIAAKYIQPNSPSQVNIPDAMRAACLKSVKQGGGGRTVFNAVWRMK